MRPRRSSRSHFPPPATSDLPAGLRARLAAALVGGLQYALWVVEDETLLATDRTEIVHRYGDLLQQLVTPPA